MKQPPRTPQQIPAREPVASTAAQQWTTVRDTAADLGRLRAVSRYDLGNPDLRDRLDAVAARTSERLGLPVSMVSVVLDSAQLLVGSSGVAGWPLASGGTPLEWSFCAHAVASGRPYVVEDAAVDDVQRTNPLVAVDGVRCYAGVPLITQDGQCLGAHCVAGAEAHVFTRHDLEVLQDAADEVIGVLASFPAPTRDSRG